MINVLIAFTFVVQQLKREEQLREGLQVSSKTPDVRFCITLGILLAIKRDGITGSLSW